MRTPDSSHLRWSERQPTCRLKLVPNTSDSGRIDHLPLATLLAF
jgi:hypothetical protein